MAAFVACPIPEGMILTRRMAMWPRRFPIALSSKIGPDSRRNIIDGLPAR